MPQRFDQCLNLIGCIQILFTDLGLSQVSTTKNFLPQILKIYYSHIVKNIIIWRCTSDQPKKVFSDCNFFV